MSDYKNFTNKELENELSSLENEFNELKNAVATGLKRLNDLSNEYQIIKNELTKRNSK